MPLRRGGPLGENELDELLESELTRSRTARVPRESGRVQVELPNAEEGEGGRGRAGSQMGKNGGGSVLEN